MDLKFWLDKIPADLDYEIPTGSHGIVHIGKLCRDAADEIERLRAALSSLRRGHDMCDDAWYSCPKSEEGCANDGLSKEECTCGADQHNAIIDAALGAVEQTGDGK